MHTERKITVNKDELMNTLKENRKTHQKEYLETLTGYKKQLEDILVEQIVALKSTEPTKDFRLEVLIVAPSHHLEDYDKYIEMIKWEVKEEIEITSTEFDNLIRDEWHWTGGFKRAYNSFSGIDVKKVIR